VAILGERVGDACALRLDEFVVERVVEALRITCQYMRAANALGSCHTGPVRVLFDLVLHVPTMSAGQVPCADVRAARPTRPAREYFIVFGCAGDGGLDARSCGIWRVGVCL
jgi:hypothetical protein